MARWYLRHASNMRYSVLKTRRMPSVAGHFLQNNHQVQGSFVENDLWRYDILWFYATLYDSFLACCPGRTTTILQTTQHTATHCNILQHTATYCNALYHSAAYCSTLQHTATHCNTLQHNATHCVLLTTAQRKYTAMHCNTLQHTATHCNTLQHTATHCNTLQHTATHCNTQCAADHGAPSSWGYEASR